MKVRHRKKILYASSPSKTVVRPDPAAREARLARANALLESTHDEFLIMVAVAKRQLENSR
jgi:hypothetical protein